MIVKRAFIIYLTNFLNPYWSVNNDDLKNIVKDPGFGFSVTLISLNDLVEKKNFQPVLKVCIEEVREEVRLTRLRIVHLRKLSAHNSRDAVALMQLPKHMQFLRYKRARERNISCLIERKRKTLSIKLEQKNKIKSFLWKKKRLSRFACTPLTPSCFSDDWNEIQPHYLTMVIS